MPFNPLNHPICLSPVQWLRPSAWAHHVPFAMYLVDVLRPQTLVELGTQDGMSYFGFCQAVQELHLPTQCYAVDAWDQPDPSATEMFQAFKAHHDSRYGAFSHLMQPPFKVNADNAAHAALSSFEGNSVDLLHINAHHSDGNIQQTLKSWLPKMSKQGVILLHNISIQGANSDGQKLWDKISARYPCFALTNGNGLGMFAVGQAYPQGLNTLFDASPEEQAAIRQFFARLGHQVAAQAGKQQNPAEAPRPLQPLQGEYSISQLQQQVERANTLLSNQSAELVAAQRQVENLKKQVAKLKNLTQRYENSLKTLTDRSPVIRQMPNAPSQAHQPSTPTDDQLWDAKFLSSLEPQVDISASALLSDGVKLSGYYEKYLHTDGLDDGEYELLFRAVDEAGHARITTRRIIIEPSSVLLSVDTQPDGSLSLADGVLEFRGWAYSKVAPIERVEVFLGDNRLGELRYGLEREDVAEMLDNPEMLHSGFDGRVQYHDVPPGEHVVTIRAVDREDNQISVLRVLRVAKEDLGNDDVRVSRSIGMFQGVSIIIPVFNALDYTRDCIESIYKAPNATPFEVIVVNNGSSDGTEDWLDNATQRHPNLYYANLKENVGFARAVNLGIQNARGTHIVILNNDTLVTSRWLDRLLAAADSDERVGIVSPMTNHVEQGPQADPEALDLAPHHAERFAKRIQRREELQTVPDYLEFFCVMIKREVVDLLGGLDGGFLKGNYEDDDYCLRVRMAGYQLGIARNAFVYHYGRRTFVSNLQHNHWLLRNRIYYLEKLTRLATAPPRPIQQAMRSTTAPKISVVIRTRNRPQTLQLALMSLANQIYRDFEVVLVNDGGDDVANLVEHFEVYYPINYIHHETSKGHSAALNTGVMAAKGRYLTYLDDDDVVYPQHLSVLWDTIHQNGEPGQFAYSSYNQVLLTDNGPEGVVTARLPVEPWKYNFDELMVQNYVPIHTWLHDRNCIDEVGLFNESLNSLEDWDFLIRVAHKHDLLYTSRVTCEYRFYQSGSNSMVRQRQIALNSLQTIYQRYPVDTAELNYAREEQLRVNSRLVDLIAELEEKIKAEPENEQEYVRQIIFKIVAFAGAEV